MIPDQIFQQAVRRLLALVEKLIERNLQRSGKLLQGFDGRNGVAVLHARNVGAFKTTPLFDITLGELLRFTEGADVVADQHGLILIEEPVSWGACFWKSAQV